jgi:hypothetical protein
METNSRVTVRRISPRTLIWSILIVSLAGESYLMSLHISAASPPVHPAKAAAFQTAPMSPPASQPADRSYALAEADQQLAAITGASSRFQVPLGALKSNPFEQPTASSPDDSAVPPATKINADERAAALQAVESLDLQSILVGDSRRSCIINNVTCEEGQQIDGFTVETIASASVTVSMGIYRFDLALTR